MKGIYFPNDWQDYELIDSGEEMRLEKYGKYLLATPDPRAIWKKTLSAFEWDKADATYSRSNSGGGSWRFKGKIDQEWRISWNELQFIVKPTGFKHLGVFPEQANMWEWIKTQISDISVQTSDPNILNLFAYTGGSTLAAASAGARVTHLDAAKDSVDWAKMNAEVSGLRDKPIRWIVDDAIKFLKREINRGVKYDGIIMDPPKFGRGSKGEVWKIEENIHELLDLCRQVLSDKPKFVILNAYAISFSALTLKNLLSQIMKDFEGEIESGELALKQTNGDITCPTSIFARWSAS
jgi:23S rRNA (cytosine1962-C5)-methyltransferase